MGQDCWEWELEREVQKIDWEDRSGVKHSVIVDAYDKDWAVNRAWEHCPVKFRPTNKSKMRVNKISLLL